MKRVISFILSICLLMVTIPISVYAEEPFEKKYIDVEYGDTRDTIECICANGTVFCSGVDLAEITGYSFYRIEDSPKYGFVREYDNHISEPTLEIQTEVSISVDEENHKADVTAMHNNYTVDFYEENDEIYFPMEAFIYLLHGNLILLPDHVYIEAMPFNIIDFYAAYAADIAGLESKPEDALINTGWWGSETKAGQAIYSSIAEIIKDFDGNLLVLYDPDKGHVKTNQFYEDAILQLSKTDKELLGEEMYSSISEQTMSILDEFNHAIDPIQKVGTFCSNVNGTIESIPDAIEILSEIQKEYPELIISKQFKQFGKSLDDGTSAMVMMDSPELNAKIKESGYVSDAISLIKFAYNICDVKNRTLTWNSDFEAQLQLLADYENPGWLSDNVVNHINSASQHLIESKLNPTMAQIDEGINNVTELLLAKTFDESPFGKVRSGLEAIQIVYGLYDEKSGDVWDAYTELGDVTYSIKIEQMVREMFRYDDILNTDNPLTKEDIATFRNQLMMFLRLDMRNKAQLYNLNCKANENENWAESEDAKRLYDEVTELNKLIVILEGTKIVDDKIILDDNYDLTKNTIGEEYLMDEEIDLDEYKYDSDLMRLASDLGEEVNYSLEDYKECIQKENLFVGIVSEKYDEYDAITDIKNTGNKSATFMGIRIGDDYEEVKTVLESQYAIVGNEQDSIDGVHTFLFGNSAHLDTEFQEGKLISYQYKMRYSTSSDWLPNIP